MARLPPVLSFIIFIYSLILQCGECSTVILGDPFTFIVSANCPTGARGELHRVGQHITQLVADREEEIWKPTEVYKDRIKESAVLAFNRTEYTDKGLYEIKCGGQEQRFQLDVVRASEVSATEGGNATLPCNYITGGHVDSIKWSRGGEMVLEQSLSSGEIKPGTGFKKRLSLSPDGYKKGNWALIFNPVLLEDGGDYFCSFHLNGAPEGRGDPAAVRMRVAERRRDQTTGRPSLTTTQNVTEEKEEMGTMAVVIITAVVVFVIVAPSFFLLGRARCLKSRCSSFRPMPSGRQYSDVPPPPPLPRPHANGGSPSNNAHAESKV
ncbi:uncharacterized protein LOC114545355 [Perca flavescens]|uniref:uncharacterized protein LOC114545355 n=1 Tax=Perca flavescens TaxID=8167 RepID=UPI00106EA260|nr:uncharacterized protein LOC114545355 [Perca flavescens]